MPVDPFYGTNLRWKRKPFDETRAVSSDMGFTLKIHDYRSIRGARLKMRFDKALIPDCLLVSDYVSDGMSSRPVADGHSTEAPRVPLL